MDRSAARRPLARLAAAGVLLLGVALAGVPELRPGAAEAQAQAAAPEPAPGVPAPPDVVGEIHAVLRQALQRFHAQDAPGVLAHVSEQYRTGPLTKRLLRDQLLGLFSVYDQVQASVRIDDVRLVGEHAWIFSTGEVAGRLRWVGGWTPVLAWERELEIARREGGTWRLFGYQQ